MSSYATFTEIRVASTSPTASTSFSTKRAQRCLIFAVLFILLGFFGVYEHQKWPRSQIVHLQNGGAPLSVHSFTSASYKYNSSPMDGRPGLPFTDDSARISDGTPVYAMK